MVTLVIVVFLIICVVLANLFKFLYDDDEISALFGTIRATDDDWSTQRTNCNYTRLINQPNNTLRSASRQNGDEAIRQSSSIESITLPRSVNSYGAILEVNRSPRFVNVNETNGSDIEILGISENEWSRATVPDLNHSRGDYSSQAEVSSNLNEQISPPRNSPIQIGHQNSNERRGHDLPIVFQRGQRNRIIVYDSIEHSASESEQPQNLPNNEWRCMPIVESDDIIVSEDLPPPYEDLPPLYMDVIKNQT